MATTSGLYDPIKAVEGMFNGSVTRIGQALKDPVEYGENTKMVLAECAKKFHDALDDCEIQLLDAKWFLESQLRTNQLRREAKAREMGTAAKRKHEEIKDANDQNSSEQSAAKKARVEQPQKKAETQEPSIPKDLATNAKPAPSNATAATSNPVKKTEMAQKQPDEDKKTKETQPAQSTQPAAKPPEASKAPAKEQPQTDDFTFAKPTPQATPTGTNDDFNFESMFGEPTTDLLGDSNKDDDDLNFDFTADDLSGVPSGNQDPSSLDTLLPGLESYANQMDDNPLNGGSNSINTTSAQNANSMQAFSNDFDLPNLGGPNIFDDFLNDDSLGGADGSGNFDGADLGDPALLDIDFDNF